MLAIALIFIQFGRELVEVQGVQSWGGMVTYWTISQERLLISGRTKRWWKALFIRFLLTPSSSDSACSFWRSMLSCNLLLLPFSVSDSGRLVYVCCPSHLIRTSTYLLNACDRSNIHAIWPRIGGDTRGAKSRGNRTISQEGLITLGWTKWWR